MSSLTGMSRTKAYGLKIEEEHYPGDEKNLLHAESSEDLKFSNQEAVVPWLPSVFRPEINGVWDISRIKGYGISI